MSVIRLFPQQDTTIYTDYPTLNAGLDQILDLSKNYSTVYPSYSAACRTLVQFSQTDINNYVSNYVGTYSSSYYFGMYLAHACDIPLQYNINLYAISQSWDMGTGRFSNVPITTNGASIFKILIVH